MFATGQVHICQSRTPVCQSRDRDICQLVAGGQVHTFQPGTPSCQGTDRGIGHKFISPHHRHHGRIATASKVTEEEMRRCSPRSSSLPSAGATESHQPLQTSAMRLIKEFRWHQSSLVTGYPVVAALKACSRRSTILSQQSMNDSSWMRELQRGRLLPKSQ